MDRSADKGTMYKLYYEIYDCITGCWSSESWGSLELAQQARTAMLEQHFCNLQKQAQETLSVSQSLGITIEPAPGFQRCDCLESFCEQQGFHLQIYRTLDLGNGKKLQELASTPEPSAEQIQNFLNLLDIDTQQQHDFACNEVINTK